MALGGATAGCATGRGAGVRTMGAATAGWTRPDRLTGTTRFGPGAGAVPRPRSSSIDGGAGGRAVRVVATLGAVDRTTRVVVGAGADTVRRDTTRGGGNVDSLERRRVAQPDRTTTDPRAMAVNIRITILLPCVPYPPR